MILKMVNQVLATFDNESYARGRLYLRLVVTASTAHRHRSTRFAAPGMQCSATHKQPTTKCSKASAGVAVTLILWTPTASLPPCSCLASILHTVLHDLSEHYFILLCSSLPAAVVSHAPELQCPPSVWLTPVHLDCATHSSNHGLHLSWSKRPACALTFTWSLHVSQTCVSTKNTSMSYRVQGHLCRCGPAVCD